MSSAICFNLDQSKILSPGNGLKDLDWYLVTVAVITFFYNIFYLINPLPDDKILDRSKLKQSADDNFKFDENRRKFSKRVENTVGKGEIAHYEQFLLFPQCFQKVSLCGNGLILYHIITIFNDPEGDSF